MGKGFEWGSSVCVPNPELSDTHSPASSPIVTTSRPSLMKFLQSATFSFSATGRTPNSAILGLDNTFAEHLLCTEVTKTLFLPPKPQTALSLLPPEGLLSTASQHHATGATRMLLILPTPAPSQHWLLFSGHPGCEQEQGICLSLAQSAWGEARSGEGRGAAAAIQVGSARRTKAAHSPRCTLGHSQTFLSACSGARPLVSISGSVTQATRFILLRSGLQPLAFSGEVNPNGQKNWDPVPHELPHRHCACDPSFKICGVSLNNGIFTWANSLSSLVSHPAYSGRVLEPHGGACRLNRGVSEPEDWDRRPLPASRPR